MTESRGRVVRLKRTRSDHARDERYQQLNYKESLPFFDNPRGMLIHRVRTLYRLSCTFIPGPWWVVEYWCGNTGLAKSMDGLVSDPGRKLVCVMCEMKAVAVEEKSS